MKLPAIALLLAVTACADGAPDPTTGSTEQAALMQPHLKFSAAYTDYLERFGFQQGLVTHGFSPYTDEIPQPKEIPLLVIAAERTTPFDGPCGGPFPITDEKLDALVFGGAFPTVRTYFSNESSDRLRLQNAGIIHVCGLGLSANPTFNEIRRAAVPAADRVLPLVATFDDNQDGEVTGDELVILVLDSAVHDAGQAGGGWFALPSGGGYFGSVAAASGGGSLSTWVHELGHVFGAKDIYSSLDPDVRVNDRVSVYGAQRAELTGIDAWNKLRLGWARPTVVELQNQPSGEIFLRCSDDPLVELEGTVLFQGRVPFDPAVQEYLLAEARCARGVDTALTAPGVAIWNVLQKANAGAFGNPVWVEGKFSSICIHRGYGAAGCANTTLLSNPEDPADPFGLQPLKLRYRDNSLVGTKVRATPKIEYIDYGIPGYHNVPHLEGYTLRWEPN